jgi:hypothetical protein
MHFHAGRNDHHRVVSRSATCRRTTSGSLLSRANTRRPSGRSNAVMPLGKWQHVQSECRWTGFRLVARLFTRQHDWRQFCFRFSAIPKLGAPAEQSTRGKSVRAGGSRDAVPGLFTFQHDDELLFAREVVQEPDAYIRATDGKIKRTSSAPRFACKKLSAHCFSLRGAIQQAKRGGAFFASSFLSMCRESAARRFYAIVSKFVPC